MDPSLQQLTQLFQDEDTDGILAALAELESKTSWKLTAGAIPTLPVQQQQHHEQTTPPLLEEQPKQDAAAEQKPCAPFYYYKDYSTHDDPDPNTPVTAPGRIPNFPAKMYAILSRPDLQDIVSWMPHGRSWKVHKPREFEVKVIPAYFEHSKFSSFIRQANGWGFRRMISKGPDRNSYYHEMFLRSVPHMLKMMKRPPPSSKPLADASTEPDLHKISQLCPLLEKKGMNGSGNNNTNDYQGRHHFQPMPETPSHHSYSAEAAPVHSMPQMLQTANATTPTEHVTQHHHQQHVIQHHHHHHHPQAHNMLSGGTLNAIPQMVPPGTKASVAAAFAPPQEVASRQYNNSSPPQGYSTAQYQVFAPPQRQQLPQEPHHHHHHHVQVQQHHQHQHQERVRGHVRCGNEQQKRRAVSSSSSSIECMEPLSFDNVMSLPSLDSSLFLNVFDDDDEDDVVISGGGGGNGNVSLSQMSNDTFWLP
eukprot:CAMPEP_0117080176 /NCGR_PEP_ID=MMETSP0472-20121206/56578_1 /TAXON_ID=693140 ORGANISM="Tiarina fusus, Strain LIS" /NCGR_SAMPLE_ID=MMETSP0472 /ASSEMBLY_ACC=CAM_ASM_000603 /LENGTH=475 /DNA_ID=CAMNT_0004807727 /DNA_START=135 /DNA_END=1562 /DNA_ORIENTATION=+